MDRKWNGLLVRSMIKLKHPPATSKFSYCGKTYGAEDLLRTQVNNMKRNLKQKGRSDLITDIFETSFDSDNATAIRVAVPMIPPLPDLESSEDKREAFLLFQLELLLLSQTHKWIHVSSCFKTSSNARKGECRYCFPRRICIETILEDDGILTLRRFIGNEYLNSYNPILLGVFRTNHDACFLFCSADETYYAVKYSTKY